MNTKDFTVIPSEKEVLLMDGVRATVVDVIEDQDVEYN